MENIKNIVLMPNLSQDAADDGTFFNLIPEPITQGTGFPPDDQFNFHCERFIHEIYQENSFSIKDKEPLENIIAEKSRIKLKKIIESQSIIISCNMQEITKKILNILKISFIDLRFSPLKFGRDDYIAVQTNNEFIKQNIKKYEISEEELKLEAVWLQANLRKHRTKLKNFNVSSFDLSDSLIFIPQGKKDYRLKQSDGNYLSINDFSEEILKITSGRKLMVLTDHIDSKESENAKFHRDFLSSLTKMDVHPCSQSAYQVLSAHEKCELIGINSDILQEAKWFNKKSHSLLKPFTPLNIDLKNDSNAYYQIHFQDMFAPIFWHDLLTPSARQPKIDRLPFVDRNHARESFENWGAYEKILNWERSFPRLSFQRAGGILHSQKIYALERKINNTSDHSIIYQDEHERKIKLLKNSCTGKTAYILGNAPSLFDLDLKALMEKDTFWFNSAFRLIEQGIEFKPKYYFLCDAAGMERHADDLSKFHAEIKFVNKKGYSFLEKNRPSILDKNNIIALNVAHAAGSYMHEDENNFSYDSSTIIHHGYTSVLHAVQLAFYMGYDKVFLAGVDLDYSQPYFYGDMNHTPAGRMENNINIMLKAFEVAKLHFKKNGRILGKITKSPKLDLPFYEEHDLYS